MCFKAEGLVLFSHSLSQNDFRLTKQVPSGLLKASQEEGTWLTKQVCFFLRALFVPRSTLLTQPPQCRPFCQATAEVDDEGDLVQEKPRPGENPCLWTVF